MASVNKVILVGHVGRDPEVRNTSGGTLIANCALATSDRWKDKASGETKEATEWHRLVFYGKLAEIVESYVKKGMLLYVEGKLKTRKWTDKDGVEKYSTEIHADQMNMLGAKEAREEEHRQRPQPTTQRNARPAPNFSDMDDDIPF